MHTTNYADTFITVAPDCRATQALPPPEGPVPSVARRTFQLLHAHPYRYTSDDVLFEVYADRQGIPKSKRKEGRVQYFATPRPCLRASDLPKKYGWGVHADAEGRVALYGVETKEYRALAGGKAVGELRAPVAVKPAMRTSR